MKKLLTSLFKTSIRNEWLSIMLLLALVMAFSSSALGLIEFNRDLLPSINLHTEIFSNSSDSFTLPPVAASPEFITLVLSGLLLAVLLPLLSPIGASLLVSLLAIPPFWLALTFPFRSHLVPMEFSLLVLLVLFGINVLLKYFAETRLKQMLLDTFGQYVPPEIVATLSRQSRLLALDGESRYLTVLFCDLRNFTGISEQLDSKEVVRLLNEYFTEMTTILYKYGATIDKYVGDAVMAFWGAPLPQEDHVQRAVLAAFEMHKAMHKLVDLFHARGLPTPTIGIGINSGVMNVGNMGSRYRLAYTVIGDAVNLAARFESTTRDYRVATIVGENTANGFSDMLFRELDTVTVRGKTSVSRIYEPLCLQTEVTPELEARLGLHRQALAAYYAADPVLAHELFTRLAQEYPADGYYQCMLAKLLEQAIKQP